MKEYSRLGVCLAYGCDLTRIQCPVPHIDPQPSVRSDPLVQGVNLEHC